MPAPCPQCHATIPGDALYCPGCGHAIAQPRFGIPHRTRRPHLGRGGVLPDETVLWRGHVAMRALLPQMLLALVAAVVWYAIAPAPAGALRPLLLGWLFLGAAGMAYVAYRRWDESFVLTNRRVIHEFGILHRTTNFLEVIDIDDVGIEQTLWDRLLRIGTITIESSDNSHPWLPLTGIYPATEIALLIDETRHRERATRGVHVEMT